MKGQKLFVRPIEAADSDAVRAFAAQHGGSPAARSGLLGKLVGELVAVLAMDVETDAVRVVDLVVAEELRRKRIARVMLNELASLAEKLERNCLIADVKHTEFLRRVGFIEDQGVMKRRVGREN
ncbi:MAG TPA: GNAT family N-acetyltransferase [Thermoanaerobaculia bacterium]|nr:GNAT family N-acetyltransferase [Thermoanaerobaculia bacterium]